MIRQYEDPYKPISILECHKGFERSWCWSNISTSDLTTFLAGFRSRPFSIPPGQPDFAHDGHPADGSNNFQWRISIALAVGDSISERRMIKDYPPNYSKPYCAHYRSMGLVYLPTWMAYIYGKLGGGNSNIFSFLTPIPGEDEPNLRSIFFKWVGSTTNQLKISILQVPWKSSPPNKENDFLGWSKKRILPDPTKGPLAVWSKNWTSWAAGKREEDLTQPDICWPLLYFYCILSHTKKQQVRDRSQKNGMQFLKSHCFNRCKWTTYF